MIGSYGGKRVWREWGKAKVVVQGVIFFFFQAEDGIRDLVRSRGLGDVYKRQLRRGWTDRDWRIPVRVQKASGT